MLTTGLGNENIFCALIDNFHLLLCDVLTSNQEEVLNASTESELGKLKNKISLTSFLAGVEEREKHMRNVRLQRHTPTPRGRFSLS